MDEDLASFEAELKGLRPAAASPMLEKRIEAELGARPARQRRAWWLAAALPLAAAAAVVVAIQSRPDTHRTPALSHELADATLKPVSAEKVLYSATEEGVVTLEDGTSARRERLQFVDTIKWQNPATKASLTWTVPREEVRVVPIRYQ